MSSLYTHVYVPLVDMVVVHVSVHSFIGRHVQEADHPLFPY